MGFNIGDRVRIIGCGSSDPELKACVGKLGTVTSHLYAESKHDFRPETYDVEVDGVTPAGDYSFSFRPSELEPA
jgi:hypothetical protein